MVPNDLATERRAYAEEPGAQGAVLDSQPDACGAAETNGRMSAGLEATILECLEQEPGRRYRADQDRGGPAAATGRTHGAGGAPAGAAVEAQTPAGFLRAPGSGVGRPSPVLAAATRLARAASRQPSTCLLGSCLTSASAPRAVYLICACLKVLTCPLLSPPVLSCPEGELGLTWSEGVYFCVLQASATTGVVGRGYA